MWLLWPMLLKRLTCLTERRLDASGLQLLHLVDEHDLFALPLIDATVSLSSCSNGRLHPPAAGQSQQDDASLPGRHPEVGGSAACRSCGYAPRHLPVSAVQRCCSCLSIYKIHSAVQLELGRGAGPAAACHLLQTARNELKFHIITT